MWRALPPTLVGAWITPSLCCNLAVPAQAGGIARSDIRVPELCEGGSPVGTRANAAFQANKQADQQTNPAQRS